MKLSNKLGIRTRAFFATLAILVSIPVMVMGLQYLIQHLSQDTLQILFYGAIGAILFYPIYQLMLLKFEIDQIRKEAE
jgi:hypothetical protein